MTPFFATQSTRRLATSALPDAPVVGEDPPRTRSAAAALLRRFADRLAPEPRGVPAQ
jgi:hypothetical protein